MTAITTLTPPHGTPSLGTPPWLATTLDAPSVVTGPVVVGVAARAESDACIVAASDVAAHLGAALEVVTVLEPLAAYAVGSDVATVAPELEDARRHDLEAAVRARLSRVLGRRPRRFDVRVGAPARVLATVATQRWATVLVAGAGRHGFAEQLLGTETALQALRAGDRAVLSVHPAWEGVPRRITCAVDFSPASVRAARLACTLLAPGGVLHLVLVTPSTDRVGLLGEAWLAAQRHAASERFARLRAILEPLLPPGAILADETRAGTVVDQVLAAAREHRADLVAMGTQGRGFLERLFVGSAATGVMRRAGTSVLCAPPPGEGERAWIEGRMQGGA